MRKGFTVIELLIVVAVVSLLAAIAIPSYVHYSNTAKVSEAISHLNQIKLRQESYRSEFFRYMSAAPNPTEIPENSTPWDNTVDTWPWLGFNPGQVRFQYTVTAGLPGTIPTSDSMGWIRRSDRGRERGGGRERRRDRSYSGNDYWFVAQARGDLDNDGNAVLIEAYSTGNHIWINYSKGWE